MSDPKQIGRYEVVRVLGEGAVGRVYLAKDPVLGRDVAIKVVKDAELGPRLKSEARAAATVRHPNILTLHDMGESDEHGLFLVFEYVPGPTLRERIEGGAVPPLDVARMALELGAALTTAHEAGVLHRDVKPENVICATTGAVLCDFGIGKGTPAYAAPETLGASPDYTPRSDQFSLAATLYEALTGKRAFTGEDAAALAQSIANDDPPPMSVEPAEGGSPRQANENIDYTRKLMLTRAEGVLRRAFQKEPSLRYPSCRAFGDALGSAIDVRVSSGFPTISMHSASIVPKATRRWQNMFLLAAVLVIAGLFMIGRGDKNEKENDAAPLKAAQSAFSSAIRPRHHIHVPPPQPSSSVAADAAEP
jgi:serine/threonine-protein kinase